MKRRKEDWQLWDILAIVVYKQNQNLLFEIDLKEIFWSRLRQKHQLPQKSISWLPLSYDLDWLYSTFCKTVKFEHSSKISLLFVPIKGRAQHYASLHSNFHECLQVNRYMGNTQYYLALFVGCFSLRNLWKVQFFIST